MKKAVAPEVAAAPAAAAAAAPAVEGAESAEAPAAAVAPVEPAPVPEVPKQTLAEYQKEQEAKRFQVQQKEVRRVDPAAFAKMQVLNVDPAPVKKPAEAPKKAVAPAPKAGGKAAAAKVAASAAAPIKTAPKEKVKVLSLGEFVANARPRRGPNNNRFRDPNEAVAEATPNVDDASKFPSL